MTFFIVALDEEVFALVSSNGCLEKGILTNKGEKNATLHGKQGQGWCDPRKNSN